MGRKKSVGYFICFVMTASLLVISGSRPAYTEKNYIGELQQRAKVANGDWQKGRKASDDYIASLSTEELLTMLEQASKLEDGHDLIAFGILPQLRYRWGKTPPFDDIITQIKDRRRHPFFRVVMLDYLSSINVRKILPRKESVLTQLIELSRDTTDNSEVRAKSMGSISMIIWSIPRENRATETKRVCDALLPLYEDRKENEDVICAAGFALALLEDRRVVEPALEILNHSQNYSTKMVVGAGGIMSRLKEKRGIAPLAKILKTTDNIDVYRKTAYGLGVIGGVEVIKPLVENRSRLDGDRDGACRRALKANRELLTNIAEGKQEGPRDLAIEALRVIGN